MSYSGYIDLKNLGTIAKGLNIEGYRPTLSLPPGCKWYNILQVVDEPLKGKTFEKVMEKVREEVHELIEEAVGINREGLISQLVSLINSIKIEHTNLLVHVHQYTGTTILNHILEEKTGVKCILDNTNFFESPINYSESYPEIDGLLSLSQCAGFDLLPGKWIVPQQFLNFDVIKKIIYSEPVYTLNHIKPFLKDKFDYVDAPVLVVNALWNPDINDDQEGYLLLDKEGSEVLQFVKDNTKIFDDSHNWEHALQVAFNSTKLLNTRDTLYLALLHDVCDHKYPDSLPREMLSRWIRDNIANHLTCDIDVMIDQVSFSKQKRIEKVHPVLEAVRDGDRMEAIGEIGIFRCETFTKLRGGKIPEDVVQHCFDKLLRLVPEGYIVNRSKKIMRRHNVIVDYVNLNKSADQDEVAYLFM